MLTVVLGGIRSGKSAFAAGLASAAGDVTYVATGLASDGEMRRRIDAHRAARPASWTLVEEPLAIAGAVAERSGTVLLDSVDTWLANRMEAGSADLEACDAELAALEGRATRLIAVSAEVGLSLVPLTAAGRAFTDLLGALNQRLAARAGEVYLVVAGVPLPLRRD